MQACRFFVDGTNKAGKIYVRGTDVSLRASARKLMKNPSYLKKCVISLGITDVKTLAAGLARIVAPKP